jgi:hypothetical protein
VRGQGCVVPLGLSEDVRRVMTQTSTASAVAGSKDPMREEKDLDNGLTLSLEDTLD